MQTAAGPSQGFPRYDPAAQFEVTSEDVEYRRDGDDVWLARVYRPRG